MYHFQIELCLLSLHILWIVGNLRDFVVKGDFSGIQHFLANSTASLAFSERQHFMDDKMTLVMLAARHGQLF